MSKTSLLAIETSTDACSVALSANGKRAVRHIVEARAHASMIMGLIDSVLEELSVGIHQLDGIVYGRGPGSFTGVRIAVALTQGLALGAALPVLGLSSLRAAAQQAMDAHDDARVLVLQDARMNEVYAGCYERDDNGLAHAVGEDALLSPTALTANGATLIVGSAADENRDVERWVDSLDGGTYCPEHNLPMAVTLLRLATAEDESEWGPAASASAVYLRNEVAARPAS